MKKRELKELILEAIESSAYKWRTSRGIAKEINIQDVQVKEFLEKSNLIIKAKKKNSRGESIYTTRLKYKEKTSFMKRVISVLSNEAGID